jgi:hypothetical protein
VTARVAIDLNVRVRGNLTYAGFEDVDGGFWPDDEVEVYERETGLVGTARVTEVDNKRQLVYLAVDWAGLREPRPVSPPQEPSLSSPPQEPSPSSPQRAPYPVKIDGSWATGWHRLREAVAAFTAAPAAKRLRGMVERSSDDVARLAELLMAQLEIDRADRLSHHDRQARREASKSHRRHSPRR